MSEINAVLAFVLIGMASLFALLLIDPKAAQRFGVWWFQWGKAREEHRRAMEAYRKEVADDQR